MGPGGFILDQELSGRFVIKTEGFTAISANITPASRVSTWSDDELKRAIREGIRPDGSLIGPPMPFEMYRGLSDTDVDAIVAFLRTIPAVEADAGTSVYNMPLPPTNGPNGANVGNRFGPGWFRV